MAPKPTILLLITQADIGGAQIHVLEIVKHLKERYRFVLATGFEDYLTDEMRKLDVEVRVLHHLKRSINIKQDVLAFKEVLALLREIKPALLHCHSSKAGVIGRLAAWKLGISTLFTAHGWAFTPGAPMVQRLYGLAAEIILCRLIGHVVTVSEFDYQLAKRWHIGRNHKRFLIRNGVRQAEIKSRQSENDIIQIVSVGRLSNNQKNQKVLVQALAQLKIPYQAKIIGEGAARHALETEIAQHDLKQKIELIGESRNARPHLHSADIFILSSNYEGLPLSILEAMSVGLPVVACDVGGVGEAVVHEQTGLLSPRGNVNALAENIKRLAESTDLRKQYGQSGQRHYQQYFTARRMADELLAVYRRILPEVG